MNCTQDMNCISVMIMQMELWANLSFPKKKAIYVLGCYSDAVVRFSGGLRSGQKHWPWRASCSERQKLVREQSVCGIHEKAWKLRHVFFAFPLLYLILINDKSDLISS